MTGPATPEALRSSAEPRSYRPVDSTCHVLPCAAVPREAVHSRFRLRASQAAALRGVDIAFQRQPVSPSLLRKDFLMSATSPTVILIHGAFTERATWAGVRALARVAPDVCLRLMLRNLSTQPASAVAGAGHQGTRHAAGIGHRILDAARGVDEDCPVSEVAVRQDGQGRVRTVVGIEGAQEVGSCRGCEESLFPRRWACRSSAARASGNSGSIWCVSEQPRRGEPYFRMIRISMSIS